MVPLVRQSFKNEKPKLTDEERNRSAHQSQEIYPTASRVIGLQPGTRQHAKAIHGELKI